MQLRFAVLVILAASAAAVSTDAVARNWLRRHPSAQVDELEELRTANPMAYGIVKALLTKRSLGLLDPKHPTSSFQKAAPQAELESGAAAFAKFATPGELKPSAEADGPYVDAAPAAPHIMDNFNWKPQSSGMDDDAMVKNVLGAVAELKGNALPAKQPAAENALAADELSFNPQPEEATKAEAQPEQAPAVPDPVQPTPASAGNPYLQSLNLGGMEETPKSAEGFMAKKPSESASAAAEKPSGGGLSDFSWGDDKPKAAPPAESKAEAKPQKESGLLAWLGGGQVTQKAEPKMVAAPVQRANAYLTDLQ